MAFPIPVYLINLDRSPDRLAHARAELDRVGLGFTRVPAVDGRRLDADQLAALAPRALSARRWHQPLSAGEVGCYLSHVECWRRLLASDAPAALVLEDDVSADASLPEVVRAVLERDRPWDMVKLYGTKGGKIDLGPLTENHRLIAYGRIPAYTLAQIVTRQCAARLLDRVPPFGRPIDMDLKWSWEHGLTILGVDPPPVRSPPAAVADSLIAADRVRRPIDLGGVIRRGWYRWRYTSTNFLVNVRRHGPARALALEFRRDVDGA